MSETANTIETQTETAPNHAAELGAHLRSRRESYNFSVGEVAERLKISTKQVEALESGDYTGLPEAVFIRGFIRSYGRLLEMDAAELQTQLDTVFPPAAEAAHRSATVASSQFDFRDQQVRKPFPKWIFGVLAVAAIGTAIYAWQSKSTADTQRAESNSSVPVGQVAPPNLGSGNMAVVPMDASGQAAVTPASDTAAASAPAAGNQEMVITVRYRSALHVVDAGGKIIFSQIVPAGSEHRFDSGAPYQVTIGYAAGATLNYQGSDIPLQSHIRNKSATLTVGGSE
ncbi:cytoskeleton protein RodZ [Neisseria sp. HSC-16F19]|nr:helix-turn-helix domain-containing protein [Neisseria sp. HSC-16F19]MCP2040447.1 cytoskeleton protein RodZ [Neisseria sp. HSC-16F19]